MIKYRKMKKCFQRLVFTIFFIPIFFFSYENSNTHPLSDDFADLVSELSPSVVNVFTVQKPKQSNENQMPFDNIPPQFRDFFKNFPPGFPFGPQPGPQQQPQDERPQALGSGFVISADGFIVTNNHVVENASDIQVTFTDGLKLEAELIASDAETDLALLKVDANNLPFLEFGDSDTAKVGNWVMAIGNPHGLGGTVTAGIVSARGRMLGGRYDDFIQTDASINRGNSGGPLFDLDGKVIGVNSMIISPSGGSIGIGFAIPSNLANNIIQQLQETGEIERAWLGVRIQEVTDEIAESLGLGKTYGALVQGLTTDSPALKGGVNEGDIIIEFNGRSRVCSNTSKTGG